MTLGQNIQTARKAKGMSQETLAEKIGVSRQALGKWEKDIALPGLDNLQALAAELGTGVDALLGAQAESPAAPAVTLDALRDLLAARDAEEKRRRRLWGGAAGAAFLVLAGLLAGTALQYERQIDALNQNYAAIQASYAAQQAANLLGRPLRDLGLITCHLGNGGSITAVNHGKSIDTTMGFTPLEGLMMGTRSGSIDPAILTYIMRREGISFDEMDAVLNRESGVLGVSGLSADMRDVLAAADEGDEHARLAIDMYVYRVQKAIGGFYAAMTRTDAVVMTAGIGENSAELRELIFDGLAHMGMILDRERNHVVGQIGVNRIISIDDSPIKICVVTTDEEMRIARETDNLVSQLG